MLIITQVFLKENNLFLLYVFKVELPNGHSPPWGQDCLRRRGWSPLLESLRLSSGRDGPCFPGSGAVSHTGHVRGGSLVVIL